MKIAILRAIRIVAVLSVVAATPHVRAGVAASSSIGNNDGDSLRRALETVMRQNEEMEKRLQELSQQNSEYVSRLSSLENQVGRRRQLPADQQHQGQLAVMPSDGEADDDYSDEEEDGTEVITTINEGTTYAQAQANAASIRGLEKRFFDFRKKVRQRVKANREACGQAKIQAAKSASGLNKIDKKVGKLQSSVEASVTEIQVLNGVVDAQTLKLQQLGKEGPFQSASTSEDNGGSGTGSLASLNEGLARIEALEEQVEFLTKKSERQQKKIKDQEDAMNQLVITSVSQVDPAMAVAMGNFAASLNETQTDLQEWSGRVSQVENKLDLMLESLISMNNESAAGSNSSSNGTANYLSYEEKLAILSSVVKSNSQRIEALENSSDVSDLELAVTALSVWANETTTDVSELYDMVAELAEEGNSTTATTTNSSTNATFAPAAVVNATLPPVVDSNATGAPGLDVEATLQDVLARLEVLEDLVDYDGDDDTSGNATVNVTDLTSNSTSANTTAMSLGSLVSWMRSEIHALTQKVQGQGAQLAKTDNDVSLLFDTLYDEAEIDTSNVTTNGTTNATANAPLASRLDQLELAVKELEGGLVVASPPSEPPANGTNVTAPLPEPMPANVTSELDLLLTRLAALESEVFIENTTDSRLDMLEVAYLELELAIGAAMNASADSEDLKNLTERVDAITGMNATQLAELLGRIEDSEAMIEDLASVIDDANASFAAVTLLVNVTSEQAADIDSILAAVENLTSSVKSLDERLDVQEDELDDYQEATDAALMTLQGSLRTMNATADEGRLEEALQALNATSATVADLNTTVSEQGKKIRSTLRQVEDLASQFYLVSALEEQMGNLTSKVTEEINLVNEGLDLVEELAQGTAESLANLTRKLEQEASGARR